MKINPHFIAFAIGVIMIAVAIGAMYGWPSGLFLLGVAFILYSLNF